MKKTMTAAAALVLAGGVALAGAAGASAATGGLPYDGTDPAATGCSTGAVTIASYPIKRDDNGTTVGTMNVRYSATCGTNWLQVNSLDASSWSNKYLFRHGDSQTYWSDADFTSDYGAGWSYGMQLNAPGCITVWATLSTQPDNVGRYAGSGTHYIC